jgi:hypothetical protein
MRATLGLVRRMAEELKTAGTWSGLDAAVPSAELQEMFA